MRKNKVLLRAAYIRSQTFLQNFQTEYVLPCLYLSIAFCNKNLYILE